MAGVTLKLQTFSHIRCPKCGIDVAPTGGGQKYCKECGEIASRVRHKLWFRNHTEYDHDRCLKYREQHREELREANRKYRRENPERAHEYYLENAEKYGAYWRERRARINGNGGHHTSDELNALVVTQEYRCFYCNKPFFNGTLEAKLHIDHKTPLSRGGVDNIENIALACPSCNLSKHDKTADEFMERYDE